MKTLNHTLQTVLIALALISTATTATAYDLLQDGVYYNINGNEASVTYIEYVYSNSSYGYQYNYYNKYNGHVTIPETVTYNGLTYTVTGIGQHAFENCSNLISVSIPNTVTHIDYYAFYNCSGLIIVPFPYSLTTIGNDAFSCCTALSSINIPNSVSTIGEDAFSWCSNLTNVTIGHNITSLGIRAFNESPLSYITCLAETPPNANGTSGNSTFSSYNNVTLFVPSSSIEAYQTANVWKNFKIFTEFKPNYLSLDDATIMHGDTIIVPVMMENENDITAFQTDIYLVNGFKLVKDEYDDYMVELSNRKGRDHVIMASDASDGAVRVVSYSPTLKTFSGNDGALFYITVKAPENGDGVYPIVMKNTRLTTIDEEEVLSPDAYCNVTVLPYIMGDVDDSGDITVTDVVLTAKYILNQNPEPFIFGAADLNGDNTITITDVVKIAHMVLDADYDDPETRLAAHGNNSERMGGEMNGNTVGIFLDNSKEYTAFQLDLTLPEGMTANDFALTERANGLDLVVKDKGNGKMRLMGYTPSLKTIKGNEGKLLTFNVTGNNDIMVNRIELVTPEGETVHPGGFSISKSPTTAVKELAGGKVIDHVDYFDLAGQRIERPESGMNLVVTTYTDGTRSTTKLIR